MDMAGFLFRGHMTSPAQGTRMHGVECRVVFRGGPGPVALNYTVRYYGHEVSCSRVAAGVGGTVHHSAGFAVRASPRPALVCVRHERTACFVPQCVPRVFQRFDSNILKRLVSRVGWSSSLSAAVGWMELVHWN